MIKKFIQSPFVQVIRRENRRIADSWVLIFATIIGPVAVFLLVTWMFSAGVVRDLPMAVVDLDQTAFSRKVTRMVDATPACKVTQHPLSYQEAQEMMVKGEVNAVLVLPGGLEKEITKGSSESVALYINNTNVVKGGVLKSQLYNTLSTISGAIKVQTMMKKGVTQEQAIEKALPVKPDIHLLFNPFGNYSYFLTLGLLPLLAVVFIFLGTVYAVGMELKEGSAGEWIETAHHSVIVAVSGKLLPYTLLFFMNMMTMNIILIRLLGTPLRGSLTAVLFSEILLIVSYQLLAVLVLTLTANLRLSLSLGSAYTMMALTFSGLTFPSMAMPLLAKLFSLIFPYTFWLKIFMSQTLRGEPITEIVIPLTVLLIFILGGIMAFPGFKRKISDSKYWGRE